MSAVANANSDRADAQMEEADRLVLELKSDGADIEKLEILRHRLNRYDIVNLLKPGEAPRYLNERETMHLIIRPVLFNLKLTEFHRADAQKDEMPIQKPACGDRLVLELQSDDANTEKLEVLKRADDCYDIVNLLKPDEDPRHFDEAELLDLIRVLLLKLEPELSSIPISRPVSPPRNSSGEPQPAAALSTPMPTLGWVLVATGGSIPSGAVQANSDGTLYVAEQVFDNGHQVGAGVAGPACGSLVSAFLWEGELVDPSFTTFGVLIPSTPDAVQWASFPEGALDLLGSPQPIPLQLPADGGSLPNGPTIIIRYTISDEDEPCVTTGTATLAQDSDILCYGSAWYAPSPPPASS